MNNLILLLIKLKGHWTCITRSLTFSKIVEILYHYRSVSIDNGSMVILPSSFTTFWNTLVMMLFKKDHIKLKRFSKISCKVWHWFILRFAIQLDTKQADALLVQFPLKEHFKFSSSKFRLSLLLTRPCI